MDVWETIRNGRSHMQDDFEQDAAERAYRRGFEHGYHKAMEELQGGYGERMHPGSPAYYGERNNPMTHGSYGDRGPDVYGEREMYGERRGVRGTGPYGRR